MTLAHCDEEQGCGEPFEVRRKRDSLVYTARGRLVLCHDCRQRCDAVDAEDLLDMDDETRSLVRSGTWRET